MNEDLKIAQAADLEDITKIADRAGIDRCFLIPYGDDKAKIRLSIWDSLKSRPDGKLILVTAINPTKAGEGKSTTTIGLADGLSRIGRKAMACLREPSLGPVFGLKGGATGGGHGYDLRAGVLHQPAAGCAGAHESSHRCRCRCRCDQSSIS